MEDCVYRNETPKMVVLKCIGVNNFYLEKVVMPAEWFWFEAPLEARVEIWIRSTARRDREFLAKFRKYFCPLGILTPFAVHDVFEF